MGFEPARDEPTASRGVPEASLDAKRPSGAREVGGEGGIRTHVPLTRQDAFEAPPLRPLRYLSGSSAATRDRR